MRTLGRAFRVSTQLDSRNTFPMPPKSPYYVVPAWWRRFMYQVLTAREVAIYTYICSVANPEGVAYPARTQIMEDMGLKTPEVVKAGLDRLEAAGFLLHDLRPIAPGATAKRHFYQRPAPKFTVLKLLDANEIDGSLYPTKEGATKSPLRSSESAVLTGLVNICEDEELVKKYAAETDEAERKKLLYTILGR